MWSEDEEYNYLTGPKTVFFQVPTFKWGPVFADLADITLLREQAECSSVH